jgi:hypothetical protein
MIIITTFALSILSLLADFAFDKQWLKWAWRIGAGLFIIEIIIAICL